MQRALSTRTRSNISASWELRGGVKWAMAIQAMRPAPGSPHERGAQCGERVHNGAGRAAHAVEVTGLGGGGSHHRWM